MFSSIN